MSARAVAPIDPAVLAAASAAAAREPRVTPRQQRLIDQADDEAFHGSELDDYDTDRAQDRYERGMGW